MITMIVVGVLAIAVIAAVVGIVDASQAPERRWIAAERRDRWEAGRPEYHSGESAEWDDD